MKSAGNNAYFESFATSNRNDYRESPLYFPMLFTIDVIITNPSAVTTFYQGTNESHFPTITIKYRTSGLYRMEFSFITFCKIDNLCIKDSPNGPVGIQGNITHFDFNGQPLASSNPTTKEQIYDIAYKEFSIPSLSIKQ